MHTAFPFLHDFDNEGASSVLSLESQEAEESLQESARAQEKARQEGYAEGYAQAQKENQAEQEKEKQQHIQKENMAAEFEGAHQAITQLAQALLTAQDDMRNASAHLAVSLVCALFPSLKERLAVDEITTFLGEEITTTIHHPHLLLHVSPELENHHHELFKKLIAAGGFAGSLIIDKQPDLTAAEAILEWDVGGVERRWKHHGDHLKDLFDQSQLDTQALMKKLHTVFPKEHSAT